MPVELTVLALVGLLALVQILLVSTLAAPGQPKGWNAGPRDTDVPLPARAKRLQRALSNLYETLPIFGIAVLVTVISGQSSTFTATCAWIYLGARVLYVPAYAFGWSPWRSLIWMIGTLATVVLLIAALI